MNDRILRKLSDIKPELPKNGLFLMLAAALTFAIYIQGSRLFWTIITPVAPLGDWQPAPTGTITPQERVKLFESFDPFFHDQYGDDISRSVTSLSLTLFGIATNEASGAGSAIIAGADGVQQSYVLGEDILPGISLSAVTFDHVILNNRGHREALYLDQSIPARIVGQITATSLDDTTGPNMTAPVNSATFMNMFGVTPRAVNGRITGLVISQSGDAALLGRTGLRDGDIITEIGGVPVNGTNDLTSHIHPGAKIPLLVERGTHKLPVVIILE